MKNKKKSPYFVYILKCANGSLYTGITTDPDRRLKEHRLGKGSKYTAAFKARNYAYLERSGSRSKASRREAQIKGWPRAKKLALIKGDKSILKYPSGRKNQR